MGLTLQRARRDLQSMWQSTVDILAAKGIDYFGLKNALVPQAKREQVAFLFDSMQIGGWYGASAHDSVLGAVPRAGNHSLLVGDLGDHWDGQIRIKEALAQQLVAVHPYDYRNSSQFYAVFVNNISEASMKAMHGAMLGKRGYIGYIGLRCPSFMRSLIASSLVNECILHDGRVITRHEDGIGHSVDHNYRGYKYEEFGWSVRSVEESLFNTFLAYRIDRPLHPEEHNSDLDICAVARNPSDLRKSHVLIDPRKIEYIKGKRTAGLERAGLLGIDADSMTELIRQAIARNYVFNLRYSTGRDDVLFNVLLEVPLKGGACHRFVVGLEFGKDQSVRVVTLV